MGVLSGCSSGSAFVGSSWPGTTLFDETLYLAFGPQVHALDAQTGEKRWSFPESPAKDQTFYARPAVTDDLIVVADYGGGLFALDPATGREVWPTQDKRGRFIGGAVIGDELIYVGSVDGTLYALDRGSGAEVWIFPTQRDIWSTPLLADDALYLTSLDRHLYALDAGNGALKWQFPAEGETGGDPPVGAMVGTPTLHEGVLYFGSFNNRIYALDAATQTVLWEYPTGNWVWSSPILDEQTGLLLGGDLDGNIFALDHVTGAEKWSVQAEGPVVGAPVIGELDDDDQTRVIYVTSADSNIYTLRIDDGSNVDGSPLSVKAEFTSRFLFIKTGTNIQKIALYASPILTDELLIVGTHEGATVLYAFDRQTFRERWTFDPNAE